MKNLNLRSSQFANYIFGQYTPRKEMLELQLQGKEPQIPNHMMKYVAHGNFNEKFGIAFYVKHFSRYLKTILKISKITSFKIGLTYLKARKL